MCIIIRSESEQAFGIRRDWRDDDPDGKISQATKLMLKGHAEEMLRLFS